MVSAQDQTVGGHWAKGTKRDSKHKMSTNRRISPSLSITLGSHMKKKNWVRGFQGLCQLTGAVVNKEGGKKRWGVEREKSALLQRRTEKEKKRRQGVRWSSSDRTHLQLSQIISAREVRGGEMSKYLNKFHRSLLRVGRCGERGIVGGNGVERGWEGWGIKKGWCGGGGGAPKEGVCMKNSLQGPQEQHELNGNQRCGQCSDILAYFRRFPPSS